MTDSIPQVAQYEGTSQSTTLAGQGFLRPEMVVTDLCVSSRKRLFEELSTLIANSNFQPDGMPPQDEIFTTLHDRERLGCTALGKGIAVPHGRINGLVDPVIAIAKLESPIDYDAPDRIQVWIAVCLLVPADANEIHLNILAGLAARFNDESFVEAIKSVNSAGELYELFSNI